MKAVIWDLREAGWATEHDALIASQIAWVLSGGDITESAWVSEDYLLDLERKAFIRLCHEQKTIDRLGHMLEHNKPLRN
jgi:3-hydroxyacyl-CoA dehydrogenase